MSGRGRSLRPGGVARALLRFFLLVILGFAAGLLIGVVSEEPELLAGHLRGESTAVPLVGVSVPAPPLISPPIPAAAPVAAAPVRDPEPPLDPEPSLAPRPLGRARVTTQPGRIVREPVRREVSPPKVSAPPEARPKSPPLRRVQVAAPGGGFAIQVGAFSDQKAAQALAQGLGRKGYSTTVLPSAGSARRFRVRVQPLADEAAAQAMATRLKRDEGLPTWVLRMESASDSERGAR